MRCMIMSEWFGLTVESDILNFSFLTSSASNICCSQLNFLWSVKSVCGALSCQNSNTMQFKRQLYDIANVVYYTFCACCSTAYGLSCYHSNSNYFSISITHIVIDTVLHVVSIQSFVLLAMFDSMVPSKRHILLRKLNVFTSQYIHKSLYHDSGELHIFI